MRIRTYLSLVLAFEFCLSTLLAQQPAVELVPVETAPTEAAPAAAPAALLNKQQQLQDLLDSYVRNEISPGTYQRRRAEILGRTPAFDPWDRASVRSSNTDKPALVAPAKLSATEAPAGGTLSTPAAALASPVAAAVSGVASALSANSQVMGAAIVPGADLFIEVDLRSARQAPIYPIIKKLTEKGPKDTSNAATPQLMKNKEFFEVFQQRLGLQEEDLERIVFSADLDKLKLNEGSPSMDSISGVAALELAKEVTTAQLKEAILAASKEEPPQVSEMKLGPADVLVLKSQDESDPEIHLTVVGGKTVLAGLSSTSLSSALTRASGASTPLGGLLAASQRSIPSGSQIKLGLVVPQSFKDTLTPPPDNAGGAGAANGGAAMLSGLKDLKSISLGIALAEGVKVQLSGDMGQAQAAQGVGLIVEMMKPQLLASLAEQSGQIPGSLPNNLISAKTVGSKVDISMSLNKELLEALSK